MIDFLLLRDFSVVSFTCLTMAFLFIPLVSFQLMYRYLILMFPFLLSLLPSAVTSTPSEVLERLLRDWLWKERSKARTTSCTWLLGWC